MAMPTLSARFKVLLAASVLLVAGGYLVSWNEHRAVARTSRLGQISASLVAISPDDVYSVNDGKFVFLTGKIHTDETLRDPVFGVSGSFLKLERLVEMYQWTQHVIERKLPQPGGGTEVRPEFVYSRNWSSALVDAATFAQPAQYPNPQSFPFPTWAGIANQPRLGAFQLSEELLRQDNDFAPVAVSEAHFAALPREIASTARLAKGEIFIGQDPQQPQVGDVRVRFQGVLPGIVSVLARQSGSLLGPFRTELGQTLEVLRVGQHSPERMLTTHTDLSSAKQSYWLWRGIGWALLACGTWLWTPHIVSLTARIPFIRILFGGSWHLTALCLATALWLLIIGGEWINERAWITACDWLLALALLGSRGLTRLNRPPHPLPDRPA